MKFRIVAYAQVFAHRTVEIEAETPQAAALAVHAALSADIGEHWTVMDELTLDPVESFDIYPEGSPDFATNHPSGQPDYPQTIGTATFQGEAWVMDNAIAVDDARYDYPISLREYIDVRQTHDFLDFDPLQDAAAAPGVVKNWPGPFTITVELAPLDGYEIVQDDEGDYRLQPADGEPILLDARDDDDAEIAARVALIERGLF